MDRGDTGFILHESFKDLKTRRAEQEAYRKALEEQIKQKRKLEEQEREKYEGRRTCNDPVWQVPKHQNQTPIQPTIQTIPLPQTAEGHKTHETTVVPTPPTNTLPPIEMQSSCIQNRPASRAVSYNELDSFNEPHPAAISPKGNPPTVPIVQGNFSPQFTAECLKYLQQVMPGFLPPAIVSEPVIDPNKDKETAKVSANQDGPSNEALDCETENSANGGSSGKQEEFLNSSATPEPQNSLENSGKYKVHVSQTSEQFEAVKESEERHKEELHRQIIERRNREEELRRKAEEEEERIQEKIRMDQEKMQREYEEELKKQKEREKEKERARLLAIEKLKQANETVNKKTRSNSKGYRSSSRKTDNPTENDSDFDSNSNNTSQTATPSTSEESIQSIGEFFDETMEQRKPKFYNEYDERVIPTVAKKLREKALKREKLTEHNSEYEGSQTYRSSTARVSHVPDFPDEDGYKQSHFETAVDGPPAPNPQIPREIAIRSAPCPPTKYSNSLGFLSTLKEYLQTEKNKLDEHIRAKASKSTEQF